MPMTVWCCRPTARACRCRCWRRRCTGGRSSRPTSALAQEPAPLEVLVCDDGSSPPTLERLRALEAADPRVRVLGAAHNTGSPGAGRNRGIRAARGAWLGFLDDDDAWLPGKLARQL